MTRDRAMQIIRQHGLYCKPVGVISICLTDDRGTTYDIIGFDGGLVLDAGNTMTLRDWLGY